MMDFMGLTHSQQIGITAFKSFKAPMHKPIVYDEINQAVQANAQANKKAVIEAPAPHIH